MLWEQRIKETENRINFYRLRAILIIVQVSNALYKAARADYLEVLTTQRDVLEAKLDLAETKTNQLNAVVSMYKELGGGWQ